MGLDIANNLLYYLFSFSINEVQEKNEYFWRHQHYELVCAYFQKPMFAFPPLTIITYCFWLVSACCGGTTFRVFSKNFRRFF